jgi:nucleotide-binding universal stress UspA family protein
MYQDILVPTDGSETTGVVLDHAIDIAQGRGATVHALYVIDDQALLTLSEDMTGEVLDGLREEGKQAVSEARDRLDAAGLDSTSALVQGKPAEEIIAYASEQSVDLIAMGTRGDETTNMLGSTSQRVVTNAPAPVLTVAVSGSE